MKWRRASGPNGCSCKGTSASGRELGIKSLEPLNDAAPAVTVFRELARVLTQPLLQARVTEQAVDLGRERFRFVGEQQMFIMVGVGMASRRMSGKGWLALCAALMLFLFYNLRKG